jgi:fatty acid desaturase
MPRGSTAPLTDVAAPPACCPSFAADVLVAAVPSRLLRDAAVEWSLIAALELARVAMPSSLASWLYPLWALLVAGRIHALASLAHDAAHMAKKRGPVAFLVEVFCAWPIATSILALRAHHLRHHRHTNTVDDPYFHPNIARPLRFVAVTLLVPWWIVRIPVGALACAVRRLRSTYAKLWLFRAKHRAGEAEEIALCAQADARLLIGLVVVVALTIASPVMIFAWWVPLCVTMVLNALRFVREHTDDEGSVHQTTRNLRDSWLNEIALAPRGLAFHVEHHLYPSVAHHALRAIHDAPRPKTTTGNVFKISSTSTFKDQLST